MMRKDRVPVVLDRALGEVAFRHAAAINVPEFKDQRPSAGAVGGS
jgi:hypothetical protein